MTDKWDKLIYSRDNKYAMSANIISLDTIHLYRFRIIGHSAHILGVISQNDNTNNNVLYVYDSLSKSICKFGGSRYKMIDAFVDKLTENSLLHTDNCELSHGDIMGVMLKISDLTQSLCISMNNEEFVGICCNLDASKQYKLIISSDFELEASTKFRDQLEGRDMNIMLLSGAHIPLFQALMFK